MTMILNSRADTPLRRVFRQTADQKHRPSFPPIARSGRQLHAHKRRSPAESSGCHIALHSIRGEWPETTADSTDLTLDRCSAVADVASQTSDA